MTNPTRPERRVRASLVLRRAFRGAGAPRDGRAHPGHLDLRPRPLRPLGLRPLARRGCPLRPLRAAGALWPGGACRLRLLAPWCLLALLLASSTSPLGAQVPPPGPPAASDGVLDGIVRDYADTSASWLERIVPAAERTFAILATLELAVSGLWWALGRQALDAVLAALLRKFILLSFLYFLLSLFPFWVPAITRGFEAAGQTATGTTAVNPSLVLGLGTAIASNMLLSFGNLGFLVNPTGQLVAALTSLAVVLAFAAIAAQLVLVLVEAYVVLGGGALFLGFAAFRATAPFAENYLLFAFQTGVKIYLLYLLVGIGTGLAHQWAALDFSAGPGGAPPSLSPHFQVLAGSLVFCLLVWRIPTSVAQRLTQGASFRLQDALR